MKRIFLFLFVYMMFLVSMVNYSYADILVETDSWLEKGITYFKGHSPDVALKYFNEILIEDSNHVEALYYKAQSLISLEKNEEAAKVATHLLEIDPDHVGALEIKGDEFFRNGQLDQAHSYYEKILKIDPNNAKAHSFNGDRHYELGKADQALEHYKKALKIQPGYADTKGDYFFDKVLKIEPNNLDALNAKGKNMVVLERSAEGFTVIYADDLDLALSYFDEVLEIDPNNSEALFNKGRVIVQQVELIQDELEKEAKFEEGLSYIRRVLEIDPEHVGALSYLGDQLVGMKKTQEGTQFLDRALAIDPEHVDSLFAKGSALTKEKKFDEALYNYDKVVTKSPFHRIAPLHFKSIAHDILGYKTIEGFLDVKVHDANGALAHHIRVPKLQILNHQIAQNLLDEWKVVGTQNRDGIAYQIIQYETSADVTSLSLVGGVEHYGIAYPFHRDLWKIWATYWQYYVMPGDTIDFTYTVFRPL